MANLESTSQGSESFVAFAYIFNLMVGIGCLALPSVLLKGGWVLGISFVVIVAFLSYISVTFVLESMATAHAFLRLKKDGLDESLLSEEAGHRGDDFESYKPSDEGIFQISKKIEMGEMAALFFNRWGIIFFYGALILYLMGDSLIYSTLVAQSLTAYFANLTPTSWAFELYLGIFYCFSLPLCFFDFQKTKLLQITTLAIRNISLSTYMQLPSCGHNCCVHHSLGMIVLAIVKTAKEGRRDFDVPTINLSALPNLFGGAIYSFMCHHSLPSIVAPMRNKAHLQRIAAMAYGSVILMYLLLVMSSGLAFGITVTDPLTFSFPAEKYGYVGDFLFLFPVFAISSTFPMLSITLRNNIGTLIHFISNQDSDTLPTPDSRLQRLLLTLLAVVPSALLSLIAQHANVSVDELVGFTGAFAGCAVMFIIPAALVYSSRRMFTTMWDSKKGLRMSKPANVLQSPFAGQGWVIAILAWAFVSLIFNMYEKCYKLPSA